MNYFFSKRRRKLGHGAFNKIWPWEFSYLYENLQMSNVLSNIFDLLISGKYESTCTYSSPAGHSSQQDQLTLQPPKPLRFWWTESPLKSAQKSTRESRSTQKRALEYKCTRLSAQKSAQTSSTAQTRAQKIAQKSKTLKKAPKRVGFSRKCSGEWVIQKWGALKRVCYS